MDKPVFVCDLCNKSYEYRRSLLRHQTEEHNRESERQKCALCDNKISSIDFYCAHLMNAHQITVLIEDKIFDNIQGKHFIFHNSLSILPFD